MELSCAHVHYCNEYCPSHQKVFRLSINDKKYLKHFFLSSLPTKTHKNSNFTLFIEFFYYGSFKKKIFKEKKL